MTAFLQAEASRHMVYWRYNPLSILETWSWRTWARLRSTFHTSIPIFFQLRLSDFLANSRRSKVRLVRHQTPTQEFGSERYIKNGTTTTHTSSRKPNGRARDSRHTLLTCRYIRQTQRAAARQKYFTFTLLTVPQQTLDVGLNKTDWVV
jgi:hypothetical protein